MRTMRGTAFALVTLPGLLFAASLLFEHHAIFWDGTVYRCAIEATLATGNPYRFVGDCAGYPLPHTYPFFGTLLLAAAAQVTGVTWLGVGYLIIYALGAAGLIWACLFSAPTRGVGVWVLIAAAAGIVVSEMASGNMAIPFYGLWFVLCLRYTGSPQLMIMPCLLIAPFKPLYAVYLLVPVMAQGRQVGPAAAMAAVSLWYVADARLHPEHFAAWLDAVMGHVSQVPGFGIARWLGAIFALPYGSSPMLVAHAAWSALALWLTLRVLRREEDPALRNLIATAGAALLLPRLKEYDCLVLLPLAGLLYGHSAGTLRHGFAWLVGITLFVLPAASWWWRKIILLAGTAPLDWRAIVDMRWLVQHQGDFLALTLFVLLGWMAWARPRNTLIETCHQGEQP